MSTTVKRGYSPNDKKEFGNKSIDKLLRAGQDLQYLLNQGYNIKGASTFVGNHYLLSERQRLALMRAVSSMESIKMRKNKEIKSIPPGSVVNIDGFNTIITLEVALSNSLLLKSMDGTIRDLAALRGNPISNGKGGYFDHLGEMRDSYKSLQKIKKALEGSLRNPNLSDVDRALLQEGLDKATSYIIRIRELFDPYGGIS